MSTLLVDKTLEQWQEYDAGYEQLNSCLKDMEVRMRVATELQATLPDKRHLYKTYKDYNEEVKAKQADFDGLSERTQMLLQNSLDSRITTQLTQLTSRYSALLVYTKVGTRAYSTT